VRVAIGIAWASASVATAQPAAAPPPYPVYAPSVYQPSPPPPPPVGFVGVGLTVTGDRYLNGAYLLEGGLKIPQVPLWGRGLAGRGGSIESDWGGDFTKLMLGVEARTCTRSYGACAFVGVDVGYQEQLVTGNSDEHFHEGWVVGTRWGGSVGGRIRFRPAVDVYWYRDEDVSDPEDGVRWRRGCGITLAVVYER
jgi:hypothetical protein